MIKIKVKRLGNSKRVIIPSDIADMLGIDFDDELKLKVAGNEMRLRKVKHE